MISLNWDGMQGEIGALMARYDELPRHIAKKHLLAVVKRALKPGVPVLKRLTPKGGMRTVRSTIVRGQRKDNMKRRGGALRRSVNAQAKYVGTNKAGVAYGFVGYKFGFESRKAIWLEFGTSRGVKPRRIIQQFLREYTGPAVATLATEMKKGLEAAAAELASGKNSNANYRRS
jgi:hypothetical protein